MAFNQPGIKARHMETHNRDPDKAAFHCIICDRKFYTKSSLQVHTRVHTGDRPYKCEFCGKDFSHLSHIYRHRRLHTGDKPYRCIVCKSTFARADELQDHRRTHAVFETYKCEICKVTFTKLADLENHRYSHLTNSQGNFKCGSCSANFENETSLKNHLASHLTDGRTFKAQLDNTFGNISTHKKQSDDNEDDISNVPENVLQSKESELNKVENNEKNQCFSIDHIVFWYAQGYKQCREDSEKDRLTSEQLDDWNFMKNKMMELFTSQTNSD